MAKEHIVRYLSEYKKNTLCKFKIQNLRFNNPVAFKMFLSHAFSGSKVYVINHQRSEKTFKMFDKAVIPVLTAPTVGEGGNPEHVIKTGFRLTTCRNDKLGSYQVKANIGTEFTMNNVG